MIRFASLISRPCLIACLALAAVPVGPAQAEPQQTAPKAQPQTTETVPDAFRHMVKAPDVDIESLRDPFASYLALVEQRGRAALLERQSRMSNRPREALENFDLATLKLVAIFKKGEDRVAMVQDASGKCYIVRRGNYMGKNNGRIEKITDDTLYLVEQVLNPAGEITERQVTLTLKEINE
ncbi:MAG: pilus assembly protein PilP [Mariprofundaceae bacterium]